MERLKGGGVGAKRVMMATQGEGLGSGFCSLFCWSFEKEKKGRRRKRKKRRSRGYGRENRRGRRWDIYSSKAVNITVLSLTSCQSLASSSSVVFFSPKAHKNCFICGVRAVSGRCSQ